MSDLFRMLQKADFGLVDVKSARAQWLAFRQLNGFRAAAPLLTPPSGNVKLAKTEQKVYGLSLAPDMLSGVNTCRFATAECRVGCVSFAGKGSLAVVQRARVVKTRFLQACPSAFVTLLVDEIERAERKHGLGNVSVRLNTFSDIPWERLVPWLFERFATVSFYDYTKWTDRVELPANYRLTFSVSERVSDADAAARVRSGQNVAVVFAVTPKSALPPVWQGVPVVDGDKSDHRFSDPSGVVVGLRAKGSMRRNPGGFVRTV